MILKIASTAVILSLSTVWAQDKQAEPPVKPVKPAGKTNPSVADQINSMTREFDKKKTEFMKKLRAEKDRKKQMALYNSRPTPSPVITKILALAKQNPKADGVEKGLVWSIRGARKEQLAEIKDMLLTHYKDSQAIGALAYRYSRSWRGGEAELREIVEKAGSEKVFQGATYYLASKLVKNPATKDEGLAMMKKLAATPDIGKTNPRLLAQLKREIRVAEKLSIGCTAPDIVGTDHEGKEFKLSDYRGKVVLLDFWGIW